MFSEKIVERCILFHQIECLTMVPGDVQPLGHLPTICPIVCSLRMKRGREISGIHPRYDSHDMVRVVE